MSGTPALRSREWFVVLTLAGCAQRTTGQAGAPSTLYEQDNPRDISGMQ